MSQAQRLASQVETLRKDLHRWGGQLDQPGIGPTHTIGIAVKVFNAFEVLLREALRCYLAALGISYDQGLHATLGKDLDQLTLGQTIQAFDQLNIALTKELRKTPGRDELSSRKLLTNAELALLKKVSVLRKSLHNATMPETMVHGCRDLLQHVDQCLDMPLVALLARISSSS